MAQFEKHFVQDLTQDIKVRQCDTIVFNADNLSNVVSVALYNGEEAYTGGGTVVGAVVCPDGATVALDGTLSGNVASITLTGDCFALQGQIGVSIQIVNGDTRTTVLKAIYNVDISSTDTIVDPDSRITLSLAEIEAKLDEIPTIIANAQTAIDGIEAQKDTMIASIASVAGQGTDTTLTQSGVAADAKATGDQVSDLKSTFPLICGESNELDQVSYVDAKGIGESGNIIDAPALHYTSSMPVISGETYTVKTSYDISGDNAVLRIHGYDSSDSWVQQIAFHTFSKPEVYSVDITIPTDISAIRVSGKKTINFDYVVRKDNLSQRIDAVNNEVVDYQNNISTYRVPTNLYNKDSALNRTNYMVQASGDYVSLNGAQASHPIKVELGKTYTFKYSAGWFGTSNNRIVRFCDAEGNLDTGSGRFWNATDNGTASGTFTVIEDVGYVCVNVCASDAGVMVFNEGSSLASYSDWFEPYYKIKESALPDDLPLPPNAQNNLLYGKKLAVTGDSICYGAGSSGGYAAIIGSQNSMTISNIGQSGGTLCSGTQRFCISASVDNMPENYDYYIVEGGVNDASQEHGETLGSLSSGYNATLDTTTLYGAMESLCKKLQLNFKGKKYGFIFPHNVYGDTAVWNTGWRDAMKICLKKWGIPFLDLSDECAQLRNLDALRIYTANSDGWHPTEDGYKLYYVPKIEAWMKTL